MELESKRATKSNVIRSAVLAYGLGGALVIALYCVFHVYRGPLTEGIFNVFMFPGVFLSIFIVPQGVHSDLPVREISAALNILLYGTLIFGVLLVRGVLRGRL